VAKVALAQLRTTAVPVLATAADRRHEQ